MRTLETDRLLLRPLVPRDIDFIIALNGDPEVARYIGYQKPRTAEESHDWLERTLVAYQADGMGHLAVVLKDSGEPIGRCGLSLVEVEAAPAEGSPPRWFWYRGSAPAGMEIFHRTEVGYAFARQYWGFGYATESARAVCDTAFRERDPDELVAAIFPENLPSRNVATKAGLSVRGRVIAFGMPAEHWEITRAEWLRATQDADS